MNVVGKVACAGLSITLCALYPSPALTQSAAQPAQAVLANSLHSPTDIAFVQTPKFLPGDLAQRFSSGSRLVRMHLGTNGSQAFTLVPLTPEFFAAADPQVSFDGRKLLFAGQSQRNASWQIWEMPIEGGNPRKLTHCAGDCVKPMNLPEDGIAYTSLQGTGASRTSEVQVCRTDGSDAHEITFGPGRFELEAVLHSGRLLLSADTPLVGSHEMNQARTLYLVDPDGSGLMVLRQGDSPGTIRGGAVELSDGTIVFVRTKTANGLGERIAWIGPGALHAAAVENSPSGVASLNALDHETLLVSRRSAEHRLDLYQVSLNNSPREQLLYHDAHSSSVQAVAIAPHPRALAYRSILHPDRKSGRIICLDAYASNDRVSGRLPGRIVRVRALLKLQSGEKILGEAPVEKDGSFYATVPADVPIRLQLIGTHGEVLKQQRSWMWVRTGEDRGCFGCHESQALAPQNRSPMTLRRFDTPTPLMGESVASPGEHKGMSP